jgi:alkaline phosphatase D
MSPTQAPSLRVIQISDTHISTRHDHFAANVAAMRAWVTAQNADLIINTGDVSMNGAGDTADLDAAAAWHRDLGAPVHSVPGNHDVGDSAALRPDQALDDARLAAWRDRIGPDRWQVDAAGWRLIGLNAMLLGTGHAQEEQQFAWLAEAVAHTGPIALFLHKPLFIVNADEAAAGYWTVPPAPRHRVLDILAGGEVLLIASGHLHIHRQRRIGITRHVWAPSSAFVVAEMQEDLGGARRLGAIEHVFSLAGVDSRHVRPEGLADLPIDPVIDTIYPSPVADRA